jgi:hypothetical protein
MKLVKLVQKLISSPITFLSTPLRPCFDSHPLSGTKLAVTHGTKKNHAFGVKKKVKFDGKLPHQS